MNVRANVPTLDMTASEMAASIAASTLSPVTAVRESLERIDALESNVKAWAYVDRDKALETAAEMAAEAKAGTLRGPLHGVPVGIKDIFHAEGMPTVANSKTTNPEARYPDSAVVAALRKAGAIILGKTETVEFAGAGIPPQTRNPWNLGHTAGGSSSGSGAAVGARMVPVTIGTQTGGSNLRPAAYCGIAGFKPSYGGLSRAGVYPLAWSLDHPGIIARSAADLGLVYRAIARHPPAPKDPSRAWRMGLLRPFFLERSDAATVAALENAARSFAAAGAAVTEPTLPEVFEAIRPVHRLMLSTEMTAFHASRLAAQPDKVVEKHRKSIEAFSLVPAVYYLQALRIRRLIKEGLTRLFEDHDVLIMPTTPAPAPEGIESTGDASFLSPWSLVGFPSATVPCGVSPDGLPLGLQIVGRPGGDGTVLGVAEFAEGVLGRLQPPE